MRALLGLILLAAVARADPPKPAPPVAPQPPKPASPYEGEGWRVKVEAPKSVMAGQKSGLDVSVEARGGFHLNDDYPINFQATMRDGVDYERTRVDKAAATLSPCKDGEHACAAKLPLSFVAKTEGAQKIGGTFAFAVCDETKCVIEKVPVAVDVAVSSTVR